MGSVVSFTPPKRHMKFIRPGMVGWIDTKTIREHLLLADRRVGNHAMETVREAERMRARAGIAWAEILSA